MDVDAVIEAESKDLAVHVELCGQRHEEIARRLKRIENIAWAVMATIAVGGGVTLKEIIPIARALAGGAMP